MAEVRPFRALRYQVSSPEKLSKLVAPPYDVISKEKNQELTRRDPHSCIRLILGDPSTLSEKERLDAGRYAEAASTLKNWIGEKVLIRDEEPSFYVLEDRFSWAGQTLTRVGLLLVVKLEELGKGDILPHERTLSVPIQDRLSLMQATQMQESPIYLLFEDSKGEFRSILSRTSSSLRIGFQDRDESVQHSFSVIEDSKAIEAFRSYFKEKTFLIADGHHRYTTALQFSQSSSRPSTAYVLALVAPAPDPGVVLSAIHRIYSVDVPRKRFLSLLEEKFDCERLTLSEETFQSSSAPLAWLDVGENKTLCLRPKTSSSDPTDLRNVPSHLLNEEIVKPILGLDPSLPKDQGRIRYIKPTEDLVGELRRSGGFGFWLKPLTVPQIFGIAKRGQLLPQKSTFFYPKVLSGLVFHPFL